MTARFSLLAALGVLTCSVAAEEQPSPAAPAAPAFPHPVMLLLRDAAVQNDLQLKEPQKQALRALIAEVDEPLWLLRDAPMPQAAEKVRPLIEKAEAGAQRIFDDAQRRRFRQILLQSLGSAALTRADVTRELQLTPEQQKQLDRIEEANRHELLKLQEAVNAGRENEGPKKLAAAQARHNEQRAGVLTAAQRQRWPVLVGKPFEFSRLRPTAVRAPDLRDVEAWINTKPLTLEGLRGRVVALHFWTFG